MIHLLRHGKPMCGFAPLPEWPKSDTWVSFQGHDALDRCTCQWCQQAFRALRNDGAIVTYNITVDAGDPEPSPRYERAVWNPAGGPARDEYDL